MTLTDTELADRYAAAVAAGDDAAIAALTAECDARDQADHARKAGRATAYVTSSRDPRQAARDEWGRLAQAQFLEAERECNGYLVRGPHHDYTEDPGEPGKCAEPGCGHLANYPRHRGVDAFVLWSGPHAWAYAHATDELREFWDAHPRITVGEYQRQAGGEYRSWLDQRDRAACTEHTPAPRRDDSMDIAGSIVRGAVRGAVRSASTRPATRPGPDYAAELRRRTEQIRARQDVSRALAADPGMAGASGHQDAAGAPTAAVAVRDNRAVAQAEQRAAEIIAEALRYAERVLTRHVSWPSPQALDTVLLWLLHANARDRDDKGVGPLIWRASPRLLVTSRDRGSGKSTGLDLIAILAGSRAGRLSRVTAPAFAKLMSKYQEAAVLDEAKMIFGSGQKSLDLQGMLLTGYTRRAHSLTAHNGGSLESVFGPVVIAGKDNLITTASDSIEDLLSRCIIIRMRRSARHYPDIDDVAEQAAELAHRGMATWSTTMRPQLLAAVARLNREAAESGPLEVSDVEGGILRATQLWRPLLACADVIGEDWPDRARAAAAAGDAETEEWLADLRDLDDALWAEPADQPYADLYDEE